MLDRFVDSVSVAVSHPRHQQKKCVPREVCRPQNRKNQTRKGACPDTCYVVDEGGVGDLIEPRGGVDAPAVAGFIPVKRARIRCSCRASHGRVLAT